MAKKVGEYLLMDKQLPKKRDVVYRPVRRTDPEKNQKNLRVLIIESEHNFLSAIEETLQKSFEVCAYKCVNENESAIRLLSRPADIVVIGPMYWGSSDELARAIRQLWPKTRIIRLASTDEYRRITSEHEPIGGRNPLYDDVVPFSRLFELDRLLSRIKA